MPGEDRDKRDKRDKRDESEDIEHMPQTIDIDAAELAARVRQKRIAHRLSVRQAAQEAGISPATLSRVERGDHVPDRDNLLLLVQWVGASLDQLMLDRGELRGIGQANAPHRTRSSVRSMGETTSESVALLLRADKDLKPEDADLIMEVFRTVYERLRKRHTRSS